MNFIGFNAALLKKEEVMISCEFYSYIKNTKSCKLVNML